MCYVEKIATICICVYILAQITAHTNFCLWGIDNMKCTVKPSNTTGMSFYLYLTYFLNKTCKEGTLTGLIPKDFSRRLYQSLFKYGEVRSLEFPEVSPNRSGTYTIFQTYLILDISFILATLALLIAVYFNREDKYVLSIYMPWLVIMGVTIVYDMFVVAWFASHIADTYGIMRWYQHVTGKEHPRVLYLVNTVYPRITTAWPSIFMTLMFSRFIILWYVNVCIFMFMLQKFCAIRIRKERCIKTPFGYKCTHEMLDYETKFHAIDKPFKPHLICIDHAPTCKLKEELVKNEEKCKESVIECECGATGDTLESGKENSKNKIDPETTLEGNKQQKLDSECYCEPRPIKYIRIFKKRIVSCEPKCPTRTINLKRKCEEVNYDSEQCVENNEPEPQISESPSKCRTECERIIAINLPEAETPLENPDCDQNLNQDDDSLTSEMRDCYENEYRSKLHAIGTRFKAHAPNECNGSRDSFECDCKNRVLRYLFKQHKKDCYLLNSGCKSPEPDIDVCKPCIDTCDPCIDTCDPCIDTSKSVCELLQKSVSSNTECGCGLEQKSVSSNTVCKRKPKRPPPEPEVNSSDSDEVLEDHDYTVECRRSESKILLKNNQIKFYAQIDNCLPDDESQSCSSVSSAEPLTMNCKVARNNIMDDNDSDSDSDVELRVISTNCGKVPVVQKNCECDSMDSECALPTCKPKVTFCESPRMGCTPTNTTSCGSPRIGCTLKNDTCCGSPRVVCTPKTDTCGSLRVGCAPKNVTCGSPRVGCTFENDTCCGSPRVGCTPKTDTCGSLRVGCAPKNTTCGSPRVGCTLENDTCCGSPRVGCTPKNDTCGSVRVGCTPKTDTCGSLRVGCAPQNATCGSLRVGCTPKTDTCGGFRVGCAPQNATSCGSPRVGCTLENDTCCGNPHVGCTPKNDTKKCKTKVCCTKQ